ncbi:hypothetical protein ABK040_009401 [Willaertia magna]
MKVLLLGVYHSGLNTLFKTFQQLPDTVPVANTVPYEIISNTIKKEKSCSDISLKTLPFQLIEEIINCFRILIKETEKFGFLFTTKEQQEIFIKNHISSTSSKDHLVTTTKISKLLPNNNTNNKPSQCEYCKRIFEHHYCDPQFDFSIIPKIKQKLEEIRDAKQLVGLRLRNELLEQLKSMWNNHLGIQHTFHSYSLYHQHNYGFAALPHLMSYVMDYLLTFKQDAAFLNGHDNVIGGSSVSNSIITNSNLHSNLAFPSEFHSLYTTPSPSEEFKEYKFKFGDTRQSTVIPHQLFATDYYCCLFSNGLDDDHSLFLKRDVLETNKRGNLTQTESLVKTIEKKRFSLSKDTIAAARPLVREDDFVFEEKKETKRRKPSFLKLPLSSSPNLEEKEEKKKQTVSNTRSASSNRLLSPRRMMIVQNQKKEENDGYVYKITTLGSFGPTIKHKQKEWLQCIQGTQVVLFVVNLCDYYVNNNIAIPNYAVYDKLAYAMERFEQIVNGLLFSSNIPIIITFTFSDIFKHKLNFYPFEHDRKQQIEEIVQRLNPASNGQKQTDPPLPPIYKRLGDDKEEEWHVACEFLINQFVHLSTSLERRQQLRRDFLVINCLNLSQTYTRITNNILLNPLLVPPVNVETSKTSVDSARSVPAFQQETITKHIHRRSWSGESYKFEDKRKCNIQ